MADSTLRPGANSDDSSSNSLERELLVKEFEVLRAEIVSRLESETQLTSVAILLLGGILAVVPVMLLTQAPVNIPDIYLTIGFLIVSLLFTSIQWTQMEHDYEMALIGQYIYAGIRQKSGELLGVRGSEIPVLNWDRYRTGQMFPTLVGPKAATAQFVVFILGISRYALMSIPAVGFLLAGGAIYLLHFDLLPSTPEQIAAAILIGFDAIYFGLTIPYAVYIRNAYAVIPR